MKKSLILSFVVIISLFFTCFSQSESEKSESVIITELKEEIKILRTEFDTLKAELKRLQSLISTDSTSKTESSEICKTPGKSPSSADLQYWLSKSGIRHNSNCRYFGTKSGRACSRNEGVACKKCGG